MALSDWDALLRPRRAAVPELVNVLRAIHEGRSTRPPSSPFPPPGHDTEQQGPSLIPWVILDNVARAGKQLASLISRPASSSQERFAGGYTDLRRHLEQIERSARQQSAIVDRAFKQDSPAGGAFARAACYQETLYLQCARDGRSAGRFRCVNCRSQRTEVTSSLRPCTLNGTPLRSAPAITLRPGGFALEPGASAEVTVEVDFSACHDLVEGTVQTSVDLHMNDALALKMWIEIALHE